MSLKHVQFSLTQHTYNRLRILVTYKFPRVFFANFFKRLDLILQKMYNSIDNIMCGYVNVNYVIVNIRKSQLDSVLHSYYLSCID